MTEHVGHLIQKWLAANPNVTEGSVDADQIMFFRQWLNNPSACNVRTILEIGFNAGLSAGAFLDSRSNIRVVSVDIGAHDYVLKAKEWIDRVWPGRHTLIVGDSTNVWCQLNINWPDWKPDLIFVDGGHDHTTARLDLENAHKISKPGTWIIVDDVSESEPGVVAALKYMIQQQKLAVLQQLRSKERSWVVCKPIF